MDNLTQNPDVLLVKECLAGSDRAWSDFYSQYFPLVRHTVRRQRQFSPSDVEDMTQKVFVNLMSALDTYDPTYSLARFVCVVAQRVCIDEYRKSKTAMRDAPTVPIDLNDGSEEGSWVVASKAEHQEEELSQAQLLTILRHALRDLGTKCQELLQMRYFEELPYKRIMEVIGSTENTLVIRVRRCLDELRAVWDELVRKGIQW